jgi:hypothetical protein
MSGLLYEGLIFFSEQNNFFLFLVVKRTVTVRGEVEG